MSFKEFDLSDYINALEDFKSNKTEEVVKHWGSIENFDMFIQKIKNDEEHVAKDVTSDSIQNLVKEIIAYAQGNAPSELVVYDDNYCHMIVELYSNDYLKTVTDTKYGKGSCDYITEAFRYYLYKDTKIFESL